MDLMVRLYSNTENEINRFLQSFFDHNENTISSTHNTLEWKKKYQNPLDLVDIIGTFIENNDQYKINMWISLDENIFINITDQNADKIIRYIYERYPW